MDAPVNVNINEDRGNDGGNEAEASTTPWKKRFIIWGIILAVWLVVIWALTIHDMVAFSEGHYRDIYALHGIIPRTKKGLLGIISAPFLHIGYYHVETDSLGLIILGTLMVLSSLKTLFFVTSFVWILATFLTWCVARPYVSIVGTGIVIFGWFGYLIITPFFQRPISIKSVALAAVTGILYGGIIFSVFPTNSQIAWEANICSILSGVICSVGYWYGYLQVLAKRNFRLPAISIPSISIKINKTKKSTDTFPQARNGDAIFFQQERNSAIYQQPQTDRLLESNISPFGPEPTQPTVNNNTNEPEWLFGASSQPAPTPIYNNPSQSWFNPPPNTTVEMKSYPPQNTQNPFGPTQSSSSPSSFNPFE